MSAKFQDEAVTSIREDTKELVHKVGNRLTGDGYLAVCFAPV